jgi:sugar phosphate isomerase/epimerase
MAKVGLQIYTVRDVAQDDLFGTIRKVAEAGYDGIEFDANMVDRADAGALKALMDGLDLEVVGITVLMDQLQAEALDPYIGYAQTTGAEWIVMPWINQELRQSAEDYKKVALALNQAAKRVHEAGLRFQYHIHGFEFESFGDQTGIEILLENLDFNLVELQIDIFWLVDGGADMLGFTRQRLEENPDSVGSFHIKDAGSLDPLKDTEVGEGVLDIEGIVKLGLAYDIEWYIVEQESFNMPSVESVRISQDNLRQIISDAQLEQ